MREDLLHFIWRFQKFTFRDLHTTANCSLQIWDYGTYNCHSGPDFLNARIEIDGQLWAGNIELHCKSSDWYAHGHDRDPAYDNVVLHVVWQEDRYVFMKSGKPLPTLVLQEYVQDRLIDKYFRLLANSKSKFNNCEAFSPDLTRSLLQAWMEYLYKERLDYKSREMNTLFLSYKKDWEKLLFILLLKSFGQRVNANSFLSLATGLDFQVVRRIKTNQFQLECLLLGMAGLLEKCTEPDAHFLAMRREYQFLKTKYGMIEDRIERPEFMRVRPSNFPTIRLSQFAVLYSRPGRLFRELIDLNELKDFYTLFEVDTSSYWQTHYTFGRKAKKRLKKLSKQFINGLLVNTVLPLKKLYAAEYGIENFSELRSLLSQISAEENSLVQGFRSIGFPVKNALDSQALIHLYEFYCKKNRCLECAIGNQILN